MLYVAWDAAKQQFQLVNNNWASLRNIFTIFRSGRKGNSGQCLQFAVCNLKATLRTSERNFAKETWDVLRGKNNEMNCLLLWKQTMLFSINVAALVNFFRRKQTNWQELQTKTFKSNAYSCATCSFYNKKLAALSFWRLQTTSNCVFICTGFFKLDAKKSMSNDEANATSNDNIAITNNVSVCIELPLKGVGAIVIYHLKSWWMNNPLDVDDVFSGNSWQSVCCASLAIQAIIFRAFLRSRKKCCSCCCCCLMDQWWNDIIVSSKTDSFLQQ